MAVAEVRCAPLFALPGFKQVYCPRGRTAAFHPLSASARMRCCMYACGCRSRTVVQPCGTHAAAIRTRMDARMRRVARIQMHSATGKQEYLLAEEARGEEVGRAGGGAGGASWVAAQCDFDSPIQQLVGRQETAAVALAPRDAHAAVQCRFNPCSADELRTHAHAACFSQGV
eukprot:365940-Chlamydomonas_euryale.AAC.34